MIGHIRTRHQDTQVKKVLDLDGSKTGIEKILAEIYLAKCIYDNIDNQYDSP